MTRTVPTGRGSYESNFVASFVQEHRPFGPIGDVNERQSSQMKFETSPAPIRSSRQGATGTAFRVPRRYGSNDRFRVSLRPLVDPWDGTEPRGYLVQGH